MNTEQKRKDIMRQKQIEEKAEDVISDAGLCDSPDEHGVSEETLAFKYYCLGAKWADENNDKDKRISELEAALTLVEGSPADRLKYLEDTGAKIGKQYGLVTCEDTYWIKVIARQALGWGK